MTHSPFMHAFEDFKLELPKRNGLQVFQSWLLCDDGMRRSLSHATRRARRARHFQKWVKFWNFLFIYVRNKKVEEDEKAKRDKKKEKDWQTDTDRQPDIDRKPDRQAQTDSCSKIVFIMLFWIEKCSFEGIAWKAFFLIASRRAAEKKERIVLFASRQLSQQTFVYFITSNQDNGKLLSSRIFSFPFFFISILFLLPDFEANFDVEIFLKLKIAILKTRIFKHFS